MFVVGTAGHIDHGKSVLVQALTGIDPDRLREEKERGMTIDLGFAWLKLPGGQEVGIVDVPGHEHFINNMLAGVGGIDLALLIIAANEGVMPQTKEHLDILELLRIPRGIAVITKKDLVDDEWLSLVRMEVTELLAPTTLSNAPVIAVSAVTGEGLPELISTIDRLLSAAKPKKDIGRPRLPIDRIFTITGSGTVVTGTLIDGSLTVGQEVEIAPSGLRSRLRGLQTHKARLDTATPGSRVAANLVGLATSQLQRGDVLTKPGWLVPTRMLTVQLRLLPHLRRPLAHNTTVSFFSGAAEALAKVRLLEKTELQPGETTLAQLLTNQPVASVKGDRFIIRSPVTTLGGGEIIESHSKRYRRFRPAVIQSLKVREQGTTDQIIMALLETKPLWELPDLLAHSDLPASEVQPAVEGLIERQDMIRIGQGEHHLLLSQSGWESLLQKAVTVAGDYHKKFPARTGIPKLELGNKLEVGIHSAAILSMLLEQGVLIDEKLDVRLPSHRVKLSTPQQAKIDAFLKSLAQNPYAPPAELIPEPDLLNLLIQRQEVVKVSEGIVFSAKTYREMVERITTQLKSQGKITLAEVRDMFQTSRKYAQALLEYLDSKKVTRRIGDERVLY